MDIRSTIFQKTVAKFAFQSIKRQSQWEDEQDKRGGGRLIEGGYRSRIGF